MTPGSFDGKHMVVYIHDTHDPLLQWPWYPLPDLATELQTQFVIFYLRGFGYSDAPSYF